MPGGSDFLRGHRWQAAAAALGVVAAVVLGGLWLRAPAAAVQEVARRDFVQTVVASGHVETPHRVNLGAQVTGTVARVPVTEGQHVAAGDVLVELDGAEARAVERQAQVALAQARERLRQLQEVQLPVAEQTLRQAQATLDNARMTERRDLELRRKGFLGAAAVDDIRKAVELAEAQVASAKKQLASLWPLGADMTLAQQSVAAAEAGLQAAQARTAYTQIRAPAAGTLIARDVEPGDVVQPGKVLMTLSPDGRIQLVVQIDEKNLRLLALGQPALASADAYPQLRFDARLAYINPGINAQTGAVEVKLDVPQPPAVLRQDLTVSVDIEVARRPQALLVPSAAVHADGASTWVLRLDGERAQRRPVRLGLSGGGWSEVLEGLAAGDRVLASGTAVASGQRVRPAVAAH